MYSNIVVGTDGSETAAKAVEMAAGLARRDGATLHLVTATKQPTGVAGGPLAGGEPLSGAGFSLLGGQEMLAEIAAGIEGVEIKPHVGTGNPAAAIVRVAEEVGADLIVVGSKGMTGAGCWARCPTAWPTAPAATCSSPRPPDRVPGAPEARRHPPLPYQVMRALREHGRRGRRARRWSSPRC